jgi:hypothetical protein
MHTNKWMFHNWQLQEQLLGGKLHKVGSAQIFVTLKVHKLIEITPQIYKYFLTADVLIINVIELPIYIDVLLLQLLFLIYWYECGSSTAVVGLVTEYI